MIINPERIIIGAITLIGSMVLLYMDATSQADIGKFGYAGISAWVTLVLQFYFRKNPTQEKH